MKESIEEFIENIKLDLNMESSNFSADVEFKQIENWDSLSNMGLLAFIDNNYEITLDFDDLINYNTPSKLYSLIKSKK